MGDGNHSGGSLVGRLEQLADCYPSLQNSVSYTKASTPGVLPCGDPPQAEAKA